MDVQARGLSVRLSRGSAHGNITMRYPERLYSVSVMHGKKM